MGKVAIDMSMSLDGFISAPNPTPKEPLGANGQGLQEWLADPKAFEAAFGSAEDMAGAVIMGRNTFEQNLGWWNGKGPIGDTPCFVLTEEPVTDAPNMFTFVTDGIESALQKAQQVAGDKTIGLMGANVDQQYLKAGLVDIIRIHLVPVLLGDGISLFDRLRKLTKLEKIEATDTSGVTHLTYRILK
jgi:dihydrofolate reductase